ncbi:MAG: VOC family protein [Planctomycetes bacterium]|nr:VOC family protein [Planctomycetota bacterium]
MNRLQAKIRFPVLLAALINAPAVATAVDPPSPAGPTPAVQAVSAIGITVGDLDRALDFYKDTLTFELTEQTEVTGESVERLSGVFGARCRVAHLRLGEDRIELTQFLAPEGKALPADSRSNDRWFQHFAIVVSDMDKAYEHLRARRVRHASSGPQTLPAWNPNAGGISAFYFKDPDGHALEIIHFPPGKGDPKWQTGAPRLFLGIDHTAIVVADTDRSIAFYSGVLGMHVAGASENYGTEQEHLNNVFGARLRITALRAPHGPGVELLEYLSPTDGRDYPADAHTNDLIHWHTMFIGPNLTAAATRLTREHAAWVSPGVVADAGDNKTAAVHIKDPDGHAVIISGPREH